jgi:hypothetical protein
VTKRIFQILKQPVQGELANYLLGLREPLAGGSFTGDVDLSLALIERKDLDLLIPEEPEPMLDRGVFEDLID